jgi:hypothetical protein
MNSGNGLKFKPMANLKSLIEKRDVLKPETVNEAIEQKKKLKKKKLQSDVAMVRIPMFQKELAKIFARFESKTQEQFITDLIDQYCKNQKPDVYNLVRKLHKK